MRIAILDDWAGVALEAADWARTGAQITRFTAPIPEAERAETLAPFEVLCVMRERMPLPASLLEALPNLKLVVTTGARNLAIDLEAARRLGITVSGTQSRKTTTAELTLALLLAQLRALPTNAQALREGGFQQALGRDMAGLTLGLVGLGQVGQQVARLAQAFGAQVRAWSPNLTEARAAAVDVGYCASLHELARSSAALSIHMVLAPSTQGLVTEEILGRLPQGAVVVNTSRAGLLARDGLFAWMRHDSIATAAIDVFEEEPLPAADPWREAAAEFGPRLLLTPHLGYVSQATWQLFYTQTVEAICAFQAGSPIRCLT